MGTLESEDGGFALLASEASLLVQHNALASRQ